MKNLILSIGLIIGTIAFTVFSDITRGEFLICIMVYLNGVEI
jgi:hypothetical protein